MNNRSKETKYGLVYIASFLLVGIIIAVFVALIVTSVDKKAAENQMNKVASYVRKQCLIYEEISSEETAKTIVEISDKAFELREKIDYSAETETIKETLKTFVESKKLTGVLVTDKNGDIVVSFVNSATADEEKSWQTQIESFNDVYRDINKSYVERLSDGKCYYDYAMVARSDGNGAVLCYARYPIDEVDDIRVSIKTLLDGYVFDNNGVVVVTDGENVVASNVGSYAGISASECPVVKKIRTISDSKIARVDDGGGTYYGIRVKGKNFVVYAYLNDSAVFARRSIILPYLALVYLIMAGIVVIVRYSILGKKRREQEKKDEAYRIENEKLAREAIKANEAKTDFLRRMSHDIRTPINGIRGMVKIGDYYYDDFDKQKECRDKIWATSEYLLDLVNNILDMNKLTTTEPDWKDEIFDMTALLTEVATFTGIQAKEAGITQIKERTITHDHLFGGKVQLKRVITNIVVNAIKYNKPNGKVTVSCDEIGCDDKNATFKFICEDTGIGMSEEFLRKMYEPFERENRDAGKTLEGVGLGLAIVKKIVDRAGWKLTVDSKVGEGTVFTLVATFKIVEPPKKIETSPEPDEGDRLKGYNILVAEDNDLNYEIVEFMLKVAGADVIRATDGKEAIDIFEKSKVGEIDAVLMDVMMPEVDGLTATREIRKLDRKDADVVPIIAMTASAFADDVENARMAGMNAHIAKPIDATKLVNCIVRLIEKSGGGGNRF